MNITINLRKIKKQKKGKKTQKRAVIVDSIDRVVAEPREALALAQALVERFGCDDFTIWEGKKQLY